MATMNTMVMVLIKMTEAITMTKTTLISRFCSPADASTRTSRPVRMCSCEAWLDKGVQVTNLSSSPTMKISRPVDKTKSQNK